MRIEPGPPRDYPSTDIAFEGMILYTALPDATDEYGDPEFLMDGVIVVKQYLRGEGPAIVRMVDIHTVLNHACHPQPVVGGRYLFFASEQADGTLQYYIDREVSMVAGGPWQSEPKVMVPFVPSTLIAGGVWFAQSLVFVLMAGMFLVWRGRSLGWSQVIGVGVFWLVVVWVIQLDVFILLQEMMYLVCGIWSLLFLLLFLVRRFKQARVSVG